MKTVITDIGACRECSAGGFASSILFDPFAPWSDDNKRLKDRRELCKIALLEKCLGRIPTYGEVSENKIRTNEIPNECRNKYRDFNKLPVTDRK